MTDFQCILKEKEIGLSSGLIVKEEGRMTLIFALTNWGPLLECGTLGRTVYYIAAVVIYICEHMFM